MRKDNGDKVEFMAPKGFMVPEGTEAGKHFDQVCTFETKPNGSLCMVKLGDTDMPGYKDGEAHEEGDHRPDYSEYTKDLTEGMGEGGAPAANSYNS